MKKEIIIYTDGACLGNPGPGGWAAVLIWGDRRKEISGGFKLTTNNRMEIFAAIQAINAVKTNMRYKIKLYTDSRLIVNAVTQNWLEKWEEKNWMRNRKEKVINPDLWQQLLDAMKKHDMEFFWVEGHSGVPENERCDVLSKQAAMQPDLPSDLGYEYSTEPKLLY